MKLLFFLFLGHISLLAQTDVEKQDEHLKEKVNGIVIHGDTYYLVTTDGYIEVKNSDDPNEEWAEYYKKAYGEDTENPNTIIQPTEVAYWPFPLFMPVIPLNDWADSSWGFGKNMFLYDFIKIDQDGDYEFRSGVIGKINGIDKVPELKLPEKH